jgi:predicted RNA-binding protein YlqC (UPF0109 family)
MTTTKDVEPLSLDELLNEVVLGLVDDPSSVVISEGGSDTPTSLLTIKVHPDDVSKVLGKQGSTIKNLRELFGKIAAAKGRRAIIEIIDPRKSRSEPKS